MGQTPSKQRANGKGSDVDLSELVRSSSDLSISDKSYTSLKDKIKKKKGLESHHGVFHGGIKKKRVHKSGNSEALRSHNQIASSSSSSSIISVRSGNSFFNSTQCEELSIAEDSLDSQKSINKPDWSTNKDAWAFLRNMNTPLSGSEFLRHQPETSGRPGYLLGNGKVCNFRISDKSLSEQHCLIYPEVRVDFNNNSKLQICLRDMRRGASRPIQVNGNFLRPEYTKEPYLLKSNDIIQLSNTTVLQIIFAPSKSRIASFDDDYKLGTVIGVSLYSKISVANLRKDRNVQHAVKMIHKNSFVRRPEVLKQFMQEVAILMSLEKHPGIMSIFKVYDEVEHFHLVMEYFPEGDLYGLIVNSKRLSEDHTRIVFSQLFSAINFLHQAGVVHRDIKPENILMVSKAKLQVKICDFGLATLHQNKRNLLQSYCGSPSYVAPEIISLQGATERGYGNECDLWSLGVVLFVCLCGHPPFYDDQSASVHDKILSGSLKHYEQASVWSSLSLPVKDLIGSLLKVRPSERLTAAEALNNSWIKGESCSIRGC
ncbi:kinase-like domain-containing protein [Sporodiniella umbellata]|nr:kinase-like domain-containing protein [Sporodiniella umbellata]